MGVLYADFREGRGGFLEQPAMPLELILEQGHALIQRTEHSKDLVNGWLNLITVIVAQRDHSIREFLNVNGNQIIYA